MNIDHQLHWNLPLRNEGAANLEYKLSCSTAFTSDRTSLSLGQLVCNADSVVNIVQLDWIRNA